MFLLTGCVKTQVREIHGCEIDLSLTVACDQLVTDEYRGSYRGLWKSRERAMADIRICQQVIRSVREHCKPVSENPEKTPQK